MSKFVDKVKIQTPVVNYRDFDLSCQNLTTQFFMRTGIAYIKEFPKGSKIRMNLKTFIRMMPMLKPTLGSVQVHNRAFFVPFRCVWEPFESFMTESPYNNDDGTSVLTNVPTVYNAVFIDVLLLHAVDVGNSGDTGIAYDFEYDGNLYVLDYKGRHYYKILRQLGYGFLFTASGALLFSALPLLCYAKIFMDYYFPAQFAHTGNYAFIDGFFNRRYVYTLSNREVDQILECCRCTFYGNDYFTSAWESPVAPVPGTFDSEVEIPDITADSSSLSQTHVSLFPNGTPVVSSESLTSQRHHAITQYVDDSLKALTNYITRHRLVGARVFDRYLADYGIALNDDILRRSQYLGSQSFPLQFSDVMSNSDTIQTDGDNVSGAQLGDYAGKGVGYDGAGSFAYDTKLQGMFIVINDITPDIAYYQGIDRNVLHVTRLQFFQDEFQRLGTQPLYKIEANTETSSPTALFGYSQIYAEYKVARDSVTGLFELNSKNVGLLPWSTARRVPDAPTHSFNFMRGDDSWQYARIFYGQYKGPSDEIDKFFVVHRCNVKASMQMVPLYDTYDFDEDEGEMITVQANGSQFK